MSDLVSMLVPLQTLPGWPNADAPSPLWVLLLVVAIPVALTLVITLIAMGPSWARAGRGENRTGLDESLWLGGGAQPHALAGDTASDESNEYVGGASVRW